MSKLNVGIDIVSVKRFIDKPFDLNQNFYEHIFLPSEIKYCLKFKHNAEHFAGKFAVKEAVLKSTDKKIKLIDIETYHLKSKPMVRVNGGNDFSFHISLSHEENFAIAIAISEKIS
jgi:holo-[acyl-carrier protein] synthase|tara:strand:- start:5336 stop:5683 length:348 start_codon:yes stop_codon:yes gene_type:complete